MTYRSYLFPTFLAFLLHSVILSVMLYNWFGYAEDDRQLTPRHIKAQIVDISSQVKAEQKKRTEQQAREKKRQDDARKQADAKKKAAAKKQADARKKAEAKKQAAALKKTQQKKQADARKKAEAKKQADAKKKAEAKKLAQAKKQAATKKKADALKKEQARIAAEEKRQQDADDKAEREQAEQLRRDEELAAAMAEEERYQQALNDEQSVASYKDYIIDQVTRNWRRSPSARNGMVVLVTVHLLPTGAVDNVYISQSSGDDRFDQDAIRAVKRAERFPELQRMEPVLFDRYFRKINLKFRPEDLRR